ncbi:hypothetical protein QTP88_005164 [Uroleucon formosanum]
MSLRKKKKVLLHLLLEEVDEEEMIIKHILCNKTKKVNEMFRARKMEGFFNILIEKHLYIETTENSESFLVKIKVKLECIIVYIFKCRNT